MSVEKAFEVPSIVINDLGGILSGTADPSSGGLNAPIGSLYMRDNGGVGQHFKKVGAADTAWNLEQSTGSNPPGFQGFGLWRYRTEITNNPSSGRLNFDDVIVDDATELYINVVNDGGTDLTVFLNLLKINDLIYIQAQDDSTQFIIVKIGAAPSVAAGVFTFPIGEVESQGSTMTNNETVAVLGIHSGGDAGTGIELDQQQAEATSITSTTSATPIDLNAMTLTTSNTVSKVYEVHFGCVYANDENKPVVFDIVVDGVLKHRRRTFPLKDGDTSGEPSNFQTSYLTDSLADGIVIKIQFFRENEDTVEVADRTLIINGIS